MKALSIVLILGLIALAGILPASAAGQGGNGKMMQNGSGQQGSGICESPDCPQEDCPNNKVPSRDGTGMQNGKPVQFR